VVFLKQQNRLMMRKLTRRQALTSMAVGLGSLVGLYTWRVEPHWLEFTYPVSADFGVAA
jgi:hypothetical protein